MRAVGAKNRRDLENDDDWVACVVGRNSIANSELRVWSGALAQMICNVGRWLNFLLQNPLMAGGVGEEALAVAVVVISDGFHLAAAGGEGLGHDGGWVGEEQADEVGGGFHGFGAELAARRDFFVQMEQGAADGHFGDVNGAVGVHPAAEFDGVESLLVEFDAGLYVAQG